jgi:ATP-dependent protease ClpP protease subunit
VYSENEIIKIFKLMGLASSEEREYFKKMQTLHAQPKSEQTCLFINSSGGSSTLELEVKYAELEANP